MGRFRKHISPSQPVFCGTTYYTTDRGVTWKKSTDFTYNPSANGRVNSEGECCLDELHPGPPYRTGGPFNLFRYSDDHTVRNSGTYTAMYTTTVGYRYVGGFISTQPPGVPGAGITLVQMNQQLDGSGVLDSYGDVSSYGATGWKRFRPGNPTADLGVFLGEIRDVPRMLMGTAKYFRDLWKSMGGSRSAFAPKAVADQWLSTQFGWMPFISDLRKFYKAYVTLDERLARIKRNNGKWTKHHGSVLETSTANSFTYQATQTGHWPALPSPLYSNPSSTGTLQIHDRSSRTVWFEGCFRYWIPDIGTSQWERRAIAEIFGIMPNPSLIWELTPWSWLVDWHSNVGDVIANMSTGWAENLAARYAYVMGTTIYHRDVESTIKLKNVGTLHATWSYPVEFKSRTGASPFGFGLSSEDLSARQWSILSALGISRSSARFS